MANVTFKLRTLKGIEKQMIYLVYRFGRNDKLAYSTKLNIAPANWNAKTMRSRDKVECIDKDIINNRLNELQAITERFITSVKAKGLKVTKEALKQFLDDHTNGTTDTNNGFHQFVINFLKQNKTRISPKTGKPINYRVCQDHERTYYFIKTFEKECRKGKELDFENINLDFYADFTQFLQNYIDPITGKNGLAINTIGKVIKTIKVWLNNATEKGVNTNLQFKSQRFKAITEEVENTYLTDEELMTLYEFEYENERLTRTRDCFLIGAFTGLRFSDFRSIDEDCVNTVNNSIRIEQHKTGKYVTIPLHPVVSAIWQKYNGSFPECVSNQKFNEYVKEICMIAGVDTPTPKSITRGGLRVKHTYKKYELISSHTARRSFATNLFLSGFPALSIMQITGHKTESSFMKYIKVTSEQNAELLRRHWAKTGQFLRIAK